jgi:hypothetical protein
MDQVTASRNSERRLVYARADDLDRWQCRPLGSVGALDLKDRPVGHLDGLVLDQFENRPMYLVIAKPSHARGEQPARFLVPVGDAWFDATARAIRVDASARERVPFDREAFERMSPAEADAYERRVLADCCPEIGFHRDGRPDYARWTQFACPPWVRAPAS